VSTTEPRTAPTAPVFVVGVARSGTTLLMHMLDNHSAFAIPWESHFIPDLYRVREKFGDLSKVENRENLIHFILRYLKGIWHEGSTEEWMPGLEANARAVAESAKPDYPGVIRAMYEYHARERGRRRWGDKTPGYVDSLPALHEMFPEAKFLHIVRDGRDVACSTMPLSFGPNSVYVAARRWKRSVLHGLAFAEKHPDLIHTFRYEDLVVEPEKLLRDICDFLGEEFEPNMLEFYKANKNVHYHHANTARQVNTSRKDRWKREMSARQIRVFEGLAGDVLKRFGYEVVNPDAKTTKLDRFIGRFGNYILAWRPFSKPRSLADRLRIRKKHRRLKRELGMRGYGPG
jgi:hypothetical protein